MQNQVKTINPQEPIQPTLPESEDQLFGIPPEIETNLQELSKTESSHLQTLLDEYSDLFNQLDSDLGSTGVVTY